MARFENGWIKIYRKALLGDIYSDYGRGGLFTVLVGLANIQPGMVCWRGKPRKVARGEIVTSIKELAELGSVDRRAVDRHLNYLTLRGTLSVEKSPEGAIITINNFDEYQSHDADSAKRLQNDMSNDMLNDPLNDSAHIEESKNIRIKEGKNKGESPAAPSAPTPSARIILKIWNEERGPLPEAKSLNKTRAVSARARWNEKPDEAYWREIVRRMSTSTFCQGKNDRNWIATIDFLLRPNTHHKVLEGTYDNRGATAIADDKGYWAKVFGDDQKAGA